MWVYIPSLISLENYCREWGYDVIKIVREFGEFLEEQHPEICQGLGEKFFKFTKRIYSLNYLIRCTRWKEDWEPKNEWEQFYVDYFKYFLYKKGY